MRLLMLVHCFRFCASDDIPRAGRFVRRSVGDQDKLVGLHRCFIPQDTVLGDADAVQGRGYGVHTAHHRGTLQRPDDPANERPPDEQGPDAWNEKNADPKINPKSPPQKAPSFPQYFMRSPVL